MNTLEQFDAGAGTRPVTSPIEVSARIQNGFYTLTFPDGSHKTFRIATQKPTSKFMPGKRLVSLLIGPENTTDYEKFGVVSNERIAVWKNKRGGRDNPSKFEQYADLLWSIAAEGRQIEGYELLVSERCLVCNRELTDDVSIKRKIGPTCWERYGSGVSSE